MIPKTYKEQAEKNCANCKHHFCKWEYDEGRYYFCHIDKSERPLCGSVGMDENHFPEDEFEKRGVTIEDIRNNTQKNKDYDTWMLGVFHERSAEWEDWARTRAVSDSGICDEWEIME